MAAHRFMVDTQHDLSVVVGRTDDILERLDLLLGEHFSMQFPIVGDVRSLVFSAALLYDVADPERSVAFEGVF